MELHKVNVPSDPAYTNSHRMAPNYSTSPLWGGRKTPFAFFGWGSQRSAQTPTRNRVPRFRPPHKGEVNVGKLIHSLLRQKGVKLLQRLLERHALRFHRREVGELVHLDGDL